MTARSKPRQKTTSRHRRVRFETLEQRQVLAASIVGSFSYGILTITGTTQSDNILVSETNGHISIFGVTKTWTASKVSAISIKLGTAGKAGGNDYVSLNSIANGGNQTLAKKIAVTSNGGSERVTLPDGVDVLFGGMNQKLVVTAAGVATLNSAVVDAPPSVIGDYVWNDANKNGIQDAGEHGIAGVTLTLSGTTLAGAGVTAHTTTDANGHYSFTEAAGHYTVTLDASNFTTGVLTGFTASAALRGSNRATDSNSATGAAAVSLAAGASDFSIDFGYYQTPVNPPSNTWFDSHVQTVAIRTLADTDYQDGSLSRTDMIGLFHSVAQAGAMTSGEFTDLTAIVNNASLFGGLNYVQVLSQDIVIGNFANAHYQGAALGNLAVGSSTTKLNDLVNKWFLGLDLPVGTSDWTNANGQDITYGYSQVSGQLFVKQTGDSNAVAYTDIRQGGIGDCYFLSSLAETALKNPTAITNMFVVNGDSTYTVRFMYNGIAQYVTVNSQLPTSGGYLVFDGMGQAASNSSNELWVALAEKAYVQMNESGWIRPSSWGGGKNVYNAISGGCMFMALNQITGQNTVAETATVNDAADFNTFVAQFNAGKSICLGSIDSPPPSDNIVGDHAYAVLSVNTANQTVTVFNPWGLNNGHDSGVITLAWSQICACFNYYDRTA
jgi:hypothetical protein